MANDGTGSLYFIRYMATGRQVNSAATSGVINQCKGTVSDTGLPKSTTVRPTKGGAAGRIRIGSSDAVRTDQGSLGGDLMVVLEGQCT